MQNCSESYLKTIQKLENLRDILHDKNRPVEDQILFSEPKANLKNVEKNTYSFQPVRLFNLNQPIRQIDS